MRYTEPEAQYEQSAISNDSSVVQFSGSDRNAWYVPGMGDVGVRATPVLEARACRSTRSNCHVRGTPGLEARREDHGTSA